MAVESVSPELTEAGQNLMHRLDSAGISPQGVLWLHFKAVDDWRLTVISDFVDNLGRRKTYQLVQKILEKMGSVDGLSMFDIHLSSPDEIIPKILGGAILVDNGIVRISDTNINGMQADALIYRLMPARDHREAASMARKVERKFAAA